MTVSLNVFQFIFLKTICETKKKKKSLQAIFGSWTPVYNSELKSQYELLPKSGRINWQMFTICCHIPDLQPGLKEPQDTEKGLLVNQLAH